MAGLFEAGFREFRRLTEQPGMAPEQVLEGVRRAMHVAQMREMDRLEESLSTLATIGSTSPYVGLFGTVWGIMNSFRGLGNVQSATLAVVAPGIAEALVATAIGLFAAIPAVIAYNRYADKVTRLEVRYDSFIEEFFSVLQRHAHARRTSRLPRQLPRQRAQRAPIAPCARPASAADGRDQRRALHRRDAGAAGHLHGDGAAADPGHRRAAAEGGSGSDRDAANQEPLVLSDGCRRRAVPQRGDDEDQPIPAERVVELAAAVLRRNPKTPVLVKADQRVAYGAVVEGDGAAAAGRRCQRGFSDRAASEPAPAELRAGAVQATAAVKDD